VITRKNYVIRGGNTLLEFFKGWLIILLKTATAFSISVFSHLHILVGEQLDEMDYMQ